MRILAIMYKVDSREIHKERIVKDRIDSPTITSFTKLQNIPGADAESLIQLVAWEAESCHRFNQYWQQYNTPGVSEEKKVFLFMAMIDEFQSIDDNVVLYESSLFNIMRNIAEDLGQISSALHSALPIESALTRALFSSSSHFLRETKRIYKVRQSVINDKSIKEQVVEWAKENPNKAITGVVLGGIIIGVIVGGILYCGGAAAVATYQAKTFSEVAWVLVEATEAIAEGAEAAEATYAFGAGFYSCAMMGAVAGGVAAYAVAPDFNEWVTYLNRKKLFINKSLLLRTEVDLKKEKENQERLEENISQSCQNPLLKTQSIAEEKAAYDQLRALIKDSFSKEKGYCFRIDRNWNSERKGLVINYVDSKQTLRKEGARLDQLRFHLEKYLSSKNINYTIKMKEDSDEVLIVEIEEGNIDKIIDLLTLGKIKRQLINSNPILNCEKRKEREEINNQCNDENETISCPVQ